MAKAKTRKYKKIKNKLLVFLLPVVILQILLLVFLSSAISRRSMSKMATNTLYSSITNQGDNIEAWLNKNLENFSSVKQVIEKTHPDEEGLQEILNAYYGYNSYCKEGLYIGTSGGKFYKAEESERSVGNPTGEVWYQQGLTSVNMKYGASYLNADGKAVISASGMLNDGESDVKVIAADLSLNTISIIVNSGVKMDSAASFLVNKDDNMILAHRDDSRVASILSESDSDPFMAAIAKKIDSRSFDVADIKGNTVAFREIDGTDWVLVSYVADDVIMHDLYQLSNVLVAVGAAAILVIILLMNLMVTRVISPLTGITKNISDMSAGDFTIDISQKSNDEIGIMESKVSEFVESMRRMLATINEESEKLKEQSDNSDMVSKSMFDASRTQADAMQNLNTTVDQLAVAVNEIARNATTLAMVVADTRENSNEANASMKETVEISKKGRDNMERLSEAMEGIKNSNDELVTSINKVGAVSEEITKIVGLIAEIADETNLLSLNASIEAARAGEAGRGFAVVATEIGTLAQNSAQSAESISNLIHEVQSAIRVVVSQAETSASNIEANSELIHMAVDTFDQIYRNIEKSNVLIDSMIENVQKVDDVASNVAAISEEQAASADEILETSHHMVEQANSITENSQTVADNSHELANTSDTLTAYVQQFKI